MMAKGDHIARISHKWGLDPQSFGHVTNSDLNFEVEETIPPGQFSIGGIGGQTISATARGTKKLFLKNVRGDVEVVRLVNCYLAPNAVENIMCGAEILAKGYTITYGGDSATIFNREGEEFLRADRSIGNLFYFEDVPANSQPDQRESPLLRAVPMRYSAPIIGTNGWATSAPGAWRVLCEGLVLRLPRDPILVMHASLARHVTILFHLQRNLQFPLRLHPRT